MFNHRRLIWIASAMLVLALISLIGCEAVEKSEATRDTPSLPTTQPAPLLQSTLGRTDEVLNPEMTATGLVDGLDRSFEELNPRQSGGDGVRLVIEDLANRLGLQPDAILVVDQFADEFPASELGCPSEKQPPLPIPALVSGQVVILQAGELRYIYHTRQTQIAYCGLESVENSNGK